MQQNFPKPKGFSSKLFHFSAFFTIFESDKIRNVDQIKHNLRYYYLNHICLGLKSVIW